METQQKTLITVEATVNAPIEKIWEYWAKPEHITHWSAASDDWHTPVLKMIFVQAALLIQEWKQRMAALASTSAVYTMR